MYLDREYKPRRRRRRRFPLWPFMLVIVVAIVLYEQQPQWIDPQPIGPTPLPTRSAIAFLDDANRALEEADFARAVNSLQSVTELEPDNPDPLVALADIYLLLGDRDASRATAQRAVDLAPDDAAALTALARALNWQNENEVALNYGLDALELEPENATTLAVLAEIYTDESGFEQAQRYLDQALAIDPQNVTALRNRAYLAEARGDYEAAIAFFNDAIRAAPYRFDFYMEKGRQYSEGLSDFEAANNAYRKAVEVYESAITLDALGFGLYREGDALSAVRELRKAVEMDANYGPGLVHLGMALYSRLNFEEAAPLLEEGVNLLGDSARFEHVYRLALAYYYTEPRDCVNAVPWLNTVLEMDPGNEVAVAAIANCSAL